MESPTYRFPLCRYFTFAVIVFLANIVTTILLFVINVPGEDLKDSITNFDIEKSVFDLLCIDIIKCLLLIITFKSLESMTIYAAQQGGNNKTTRNVLKFFTAFFIVGCFIYITYKDVMVLKKYDTDKHIMKHDIHYALCISSFCFVVIEFFMYLLYLRHLVYLQSRFYVSMNDVEDGGKKDKKKEVNLRRLLTLIGPDKWKLFFGSIGLIGSTGSTIFAPRYFGKVIEAAAFGTMSDLNNKIIILLCIYMGGAVAAFFRSWLYTLAGQSIVARLRKDLFNHLIKQEIAFFDTNRTGELMNRLSSDSQVIQNALSVNISMLLRYFLQIIGSLVIMFYTSPKLGGVLIAVVPIVGIGAQQYGAYVRKQQKKFQDELATSASSAEETLSSIRTVRSFAQESKSGAEYGEFIDNSYKAGQKLSLASGFFNFGNGVVAQGAIVLVLWYGGKLVNEKTMSVGDLTSFILYALNVALAFAFLSSLYGDFMKAVGSSVRIFEIFDRKPVLVTGEITMPSAKVDIEFDEVSFSYPSRPETTVLQLLSFKVQPGETIALVGPSGGGKTTVINLLERFYDPLEGRILVDNVPLPSVDTYWFRKRVAIVSQEPVLFATTIAKNIAYGRDASQEEIEDAAKQANAHEFIQTFDNGYETNVGERGIKLSGGQKQRVAIARALLMNPDILLLDEATSALDAESEALVQEAIDRAMIGRTVIVIAHRLSTVRDANKVLVISKGTVVEKGTHDELLQFDGVYKKLVLRQLEKSSNDDDKSSKEESSETDDEKENNPSLMRQISNSLL